MQPYMGHMGGGYYPISQVHFLYQNQPYVNQYFLGVRNQRAQTRLPFLSTLSLPDQSKLMNDPLCHDPMWLLFLSKLTSDIQKFEAKNGNDPGDNVTTFHLWLSSNSLNHDSV